MGSPLLRAERGQSWANLDLACVDLPSGEAMSESKAVLDNKERCGMKAGGRTAAVRIRDVRIRQNSWKEPTLRRSQTACLLRVCLRKQVGFGSQ
ncbi:unnamed protein product [Vitrella brassicaformis CCMP3155]|uniref:Uncharacterized protein n=1 Tax=Vitrella brassicaformis (strain CCMP3155) TaxID=1169540 RepID=A0A0G4GFW7_VITBC|nr:unnamed protein product [Vitrella brassicaformis CCMP3155]|eukprot:CEM28409.1 unnamed protein product [Vitrella brassicaformis CCMP3155]